MSETDKPVLIDHDSGQVVVEMETNPLHSHIKRAAAPEGLTVAEILGSDFPGEVFLNGYRLPRDQRGMVRPKAGATIQIDMPPGGGGGGGGGKNPLRTILSIAVVAAAVFAPYLAFSSAFIATGAGAAASAALSATVGIVGNLAVNALVPPTQASLPSVGSDTYKNLDSITRFSNRIDRYGAAPQVFGRRSFYPKVVGQAYTEYDGDKQFGHVLLLLGYGPLSVKKLTIQGTTFEDYNADKELIKWDIGENPAYYVNDSNSKQLQLTLDNDDDSYVRTTEDETDEIVVSLTSQRLFYVDKNTHHHGVTVYYRVEYREKGATDWKNAALAAEKDYSSSVMYDHVGDPDSYNTVQTTVGTFKNGVRGRQPATFKEPVYNAPGDTRVRVYGQQNKPTRVSMRWRVPTGQYDVRVTRLSDRLDSGHPTQVYKDSYWSGLRSVSHQAPVDIEGAVLLSVRIQADTSLNGVIDQIKADVQSHLKTFDGDQWTDPKPTSSPAWAYSHALAGYSASRPVGYSSLNGPAMRAWNQECANRGWTVSTVVDTAISSFDLAKEIAASAFASWSIDRSGYYSVVRDFANTVSRQTFGPHNTWDFSSSRSIEHETHALRVQFKNKEKDWDDDEVLVFNTGYDETNATRFETLQLSLVEDEKQAKIAGLYHLSVARNRPENYSFKTNIRALRCMRGDSIRVQHDVPLWGSGSGNVIHIVSDENNAQKRFTLDDTANLTGDEDLVARATHVRNGKTELVSLVNPGPGRHSTFYLRNAGDIQFGIDDIVAIGRRNYETAKLKVTKIEFINTDFDAKLTCVDEAPGIQQVFDGNIVTRDPGITLPPPEVRTPPAKPSFISLISDGSVAIEDSNGSKTYRLQAKVAANDSSTPVDRLVVAIRPRGSVDGDWQSSIAQDGLAYFTDVEPGAHVDVRAISIGTNMLESTPVYRYDYQIHGEDLQPPSSVKVERGTYQVKLAPQGGRPADLYEFYRSKTQLDDDQIESQATFVDQLQTLTDGDLLPDTKYFYYIRRINKYGRSDWYVLSVTTRNDESAVMKTLSKPFKQSELEGTIFEPIHLITAPEDTEGSVSYKVAQEAQKRADALLNEKNNRQAAIDNAQQVNQSGRESLAQSISTLAAGTGEQFDVQTAWYFDNDLQGWQGGAVNKGFLVGDRAGSTAFTSPAGLGVEGEKHRFFKARIKRTGEPGWVGSLKWKAPGDTDWAGEATIDEPAYQADGDTTITFKDIEWTGEIDQICLELAAVDDADNHIDIDWMAVGSPMPGASTSALQRETEARMTKDQAEADARETLATQVRGGYEGDDPSQLTKGLIYNERKNRISDKKALLQDIQNLQASVKSNDDDIEAANQQISTVETDAKNARASLKTTLQSDYNDQFVKLRQTLETKATKDTVESLWTVRLEGQTKDGDNLFAGFGLGVDGKTSRAVFNVNEFAIGSADTNTTYAFMVKNGRVVMDEALIGTVTFTKLVDGSGNFLVNEKGELKAKYIETDSVTIGSISGGQEVVNEAATAKTLAGAAQLSNNSTYTGTFQPGPNSWFVTVRNKPSDYSGPRNAFVPLDQIENYPISRYGFYQDDADIISGRNIADHYLGTAESEISVSADTNLNITFTHDDGGGVYVNGTLIYSSDSYTTGATATLPLKAGKNKVVFVWNENTGEDGIFAVSPVISSAVDAVDSTYCLKIGDLWIDSDSDNEQYRWDGSNWVSVRDGTIAKAATTANWSGVSGNDKPNDVQKNFANISAHGWYRVAMNPGNRAKARFIIWDEESSAHNSCEFILSCEYNNKSQASFSLIDSSRYDNKTIEKIRLLTKGPYDEMYVDVYMARGVSPLYIQILDNVQQEGWTIQNLGASTIPDGYNSTEWEVDLASRVDNTASNTSKDTSKVNGRASSDVTSGIDSAQADATKSLQQLTRSAANLVAKPYFYDGDPGDWDSDIVSTGDNIRVTNRDTYENHWFDVVPGEKLYLAFNAYTRNANYTVKFGIHTSAGWVAACGVPAGTASETDASGQISVPSGVTSAQPWVQINGLDNLGEAFVKNFYIGRTQPGADVTADSRQGVDWLTDAGALASLDDITLNKVTDAGTLAALNSDALVYASTTAPSNPAANPLWADTSGSPTILKHWTGSTWTQVATLNKGALADLDAADWSSQVSGSGKPADNADVTGSNTANDVKTGGGRAVNEHGADKTSNNTSKSTKSGKSPHNVNGQPSWEFNEDGSSGIRGETSDGQVEILPNGVFIYDGNGNLRVELGRLT